MQKGVCRSAILFTTQYSEAFKGKIAILHLAYTEPKHRGNGLMCDLFTEAKEKGGYLGNVKAILCQPVTEDADVYWENRGFTKVLEGDWKDDEEEWTVNSQKALKKCRMDESTFLAVSVELFDAEYPVMIYSKRR